MTDSKKVQELTLNTLNVFIDYCKKHNLRYYLTGGALIGVIRHKGFIPWDDDIDLVMPRKDFDKLQELLKFEMPQGFGICNRFTDKNWHFGFSQFIDMKSEIEINLAYRPRIAHIWIDIYPLDGLPNNKVVRWFRVKNVLIKRYLVQIAHINTQVDSYRKRPFYEKLILKFCQIFKIGKFINTKETISKMETILRKSNFDETNWCGNMLGRYREREIVPSEWFGKPVKAKFEGEIVNVPFKSHEILCAIYGDYMKLPPERDRVTHRVKIIKCRNLENSQE